VPLHRILVGDCRARLAELPERSVQCVVTSPPYLGQRRYGGGEEIGAEETVARYVENVVGAFRHVRRVLADDGVIWVNLDDAYADRRRGRELPPRSLMGLPWRVAFGLQDDGWTLRCDVIWEKPNTMPDGTARDRPSRVHEYLLLFSKGEDYYWNQDAVREPYETWEHSSRYAKTYALSAVAKGGGQPGNTNNVGIHSRPGSPLGRNRRSVWKISTVPGPGFHFATYPPGLVEPCILAGSRPGDTVLDPFAGSGTTLREAVRLGRAAVGIELYADIAERARELGAQPPLIGTIPA
jgi:DNA modification methylase